MSVISEVGRRKAELEGKRDLARMLIAQIEAYRSVRTINDTQRRVANWWEESILSSLRLACELLHSSDFVDAAEIRREIERLENQIEERKAARAAA